MISTKIYQNSELQAGPILKQHEFTVVTRVSGFIGDRLHLGVDLCAVNSYEDNLGLETDEEESLSEIPMFQRDMLETQMNLTLTRLSKELFDLRILKYHQQNYLGSQHPGALDEIERLEDKAISKRIKIKYEKTKRQMKLIEKELVRQRKFLRELDEIEKEASQKQTAALKKTRKKQRKILNTQLKQDERNIKEKFKGKFVAPPRSISEEYENSESAQNSESSPPRNLTENPTGTDSLENIKKKKFKDGTDEQVDGDQNNLASSISSCGSDSILTPRLLQVDQAQTDLYDKQTQTSSFAHQDDATTNAVLDTKFVPTKKLENNGN